MPAAARAGFRFQSTLPAWGETRRQPPSTSGCEFQSTLPAWGETIDALPLAVCRCISIHSPRMGRDLLMMVTCGLRRGISIHSPRMGRDRARPLI